MIDYANKVFNSRNNLVARYLDDNYDESIEELNPNYDQTFDDEDVEII